MAGNDRKKKKYIFSISLNDIQNYTGHTCGLVVPQDFGEKDLNLSKNSKQKNSKSETFLNTIWI